jgi:cytochrome c556
MAHALLRAVSIDSLSGLGVAMAALLLAGTIALAQAPSDPPAATVRQLMLDLIHPSSNDILLAIYRGGPKDDKEWAAVRRAAITLAESGNLLTMRGRARDQAEWMKDAKVLADAGNAAYRAAQAKDNTALAALAGALDASCTTCHKQYRPNVFPKDGGSK